MSNKECILANLIGDSTVHVMEQSHHIAVTQSHWFKAYNAIWTDFTLITKSSYHITCLRESSTVSSSIPHTSNLNVVQMLLGSNVSVTRNMPSEWFPGSY